MPTNTEFTDMYSTPSYNIIIREEDINLLDEDICLEGNEDYRCKQGSIIGTYSIGLSTARKLIESFNDVINLHSKNSHLHYVRADGFGDFTFLNESDEESFYRVYSETLIIPERKIGDDIYLGSIWYQFVPKDYQGLVMEFNIPIYDIIKWVEYFDKHENNQRT